MTSVVRQSASDPLESPTMLPVFTTRTDLDTMYLASYQGLSMGTAALHFDNPASRMSWISTKVSSVIPHRRFRGRRPHAT